MSTNGKGSKRRPETTPGTFVRNWEGINWNREDYQPQGPRPHMGWQLEQDLKATEKEGAHPFPEPPE